MNEFRPKINRGKMSGMTSFFEKLLKSGQTVQNVPNFKKFLSSPKWPKSEKGQSG